MHLCQSCLPRLVACGGCQVGLHWWKWYTARFDEKTIIFHPNEEFSTVFVSGASGVMNHPTQSHMASHKHIQWEWENEDGEHVRQGEHIYLHFCGCSRSIIHQTAKVVVNYESYLPWMHSLIAFTSCDDAKVDLFLNGYIFQLSLLLAEYEVCD